MLYRRVDIIDIHFYAHWSVLAQSVIIGYEERMKSGFSVSLS